MASLDIWRVMYSRAPQHQQIWHLPKLQYGFGNPCASPTNAPVSGLEVELISLYSTSPDVDKQLI
mgnify:CR=1 FL=1